MLPLDDALNKAFDANNSLQDTTVADLSNLEQQEMQLVQDRWGDVDVTRRREIASRIAEMAEDNFDLDFTGMLLLCIHDVDPVVRASAAIGLGQYEDNVLIAPLVHLLTADDSELVRINTAQSLGRFALMAELGMATEEQTVDIRTALLNIVERIDESSELRQRSLEAISPWCSPKVSELIEGAYHSGDNEFKVSAIYSMGMNCDTRWLPILYKEIKGTNPQMRYEAAHACGEISDPQAVPHLLPLLYDEDIEVQTATIWALGQIGGNEAKQALQSLLESGDSYIKDTAQEALAQLSTYEDTIHI